MVEKAWVGIFVGELFSNQGHLGAAVVGAHPDLLYKPVMRVEGACASVGPGVRQRSRVHPSGNRRGLGGGRRGPNHAKRPNRRRLPGSCLSLRAPARDRRLHVSGLVRTARQVPSQETFGLTDQELAHVSVKAYANANRNPLAHMKAVSMDLDTASQASDRNPAFLTNEELAPYIKVSDCSQVSDGGSALVVVSEAGLQKLGKTPADAIELVGLAHATGNLWEDTDPNHLLTTRNALQRVYKQSGVGISDVDVAEVHDCFTITELLMMEAMGMAEAGQAVNLVKEGRTGIEGDLPINTGGGLVGFGHPVGATGVKQIVEVWRQMKGQCGDYQVPNVPAVGLTVNMGGDDKTVVTSVFRNH